MDRTGTEKNESKGKRTVQMNRKKERHTAGRISEEAYFTVEAALVMPVVLAIIVMIIYMSFYLYDRCVMQQDCCVLSYRQSIEKGTADRVSREKIREQFGEKLFMLSGLETGASSG